MPRTPRPGARGSVASKLTVRSYQRRPTGGSRRRLTRHDGAKRLAQRAHRMQHRGRLVAAMRHAVRAAVVLAAAVLLPVGRLDEFLVRLGVAVAHQVARALPAEDRVARDAPRRALEVDLALEEVEEERRVVETPLLALAVCEGLGEELAGLRHPGEVVLVGCLLIGVRRR